MRKTGKQLEAIKKKYGVDELWSYSRISSWHTSKYEWFLKYVKHEEPLDDKISAYGYLGNAAHDIIERFYNGEIEQEDMWPEYEDKWNEYIEICGYKFNKTDSEKNKKAQEKYFDSMKEFFHSFTPLPNKVRTEQFLLIKVTDDIYVQGYADAITTDNNGNYVIIDWKTSSIYKGKALKEHCDQLALYAEALHQKGVPKEKIRICFNFLKYVKVEYQQVNGKIGETVIERRELGEKLQNRVKTWLKKEKDLSEEDIETILNNVYMENSLDSLPKNVKEKFKISDAFVFIKDGFEHYEGLKQKIIDTVAEINEARDEYDQTGNDKVFWNTEAELREQEYYLYNITDYAVIQLKDFKDMLDRREADKRAANDLLGIEAMIKQEDDLDDVLGDMSWMD